MWMKSGRGHKPYGCENREFHTDLKKLAGADIETKLNAVGHHLESGIAKNIGYLVREVVTNGPDARSSRKDPDFYKHVVQAAPMLSKVLRENGHADAPFADTITVEDLLRARLPGVGSAVVSEVYEVVAGHIHDMDKAHTVSFHADTHAAARMGVAAKELIARHYLEAAVVKGITYIVAEVKENGRNASSCGGYPDFYWQVVDAAPMLSKVLQENGLSTEAAAATALALPAREFDARSRERGPVR
ncbi:hypothetical protein ACCS93_34970 [Rhizobium ruizarguesonis]